MLESLMARAERIAAEQTLRRKARLAAELRDSLSSEVVVSVDEAGLTLAGRRTAIEPELRWIMAGAIK